MIFDLVIIGGGASGFMAASVAIDNGVKSIIILESSKKILEKVRISGGGRCNVTNACWDNSNLVVNYPRGEKQLFGLFSRFSTIQAFEWFKKRGLSLKIENDGRIFPKSDSSFDVIKCLSQTAVKSGIGIHTSSHVKDIKVSNIGYDVLLQGNKLYRSKNILLCTGGHPSGRKIAKQLGHTIVKPVPSLFSLSLLNNPLKACSGISVNSCIKIIVNKSKFIDNGKLLLTHWGFSGPVILKLSAFSARCLYSNNYKAEIFINWLCKTDLEVRQELSLFKGLNLNKSIWKYKPFPELPKRLWIALLSQSGFDLNYKWVNISKSNQEKLIKILINSKYNVKGRGPFGDEFVTAGGVSLDEINLKSMESKIHKGLYFAGEIINVDGITGGFNFQHCWTTGWLAGMGCCLKS